MPVGFGSFSNLEELQLHSNRLSGQIPSELGTRPHDEPCHEGIVRPPQGFKPTPPAPKVEVHSLAHI